MLRLETLRRSARVASLLALDYVGMMAALLTALSLKLAINGRFDIAVAWHQMTHWIAFAYLVTVLMFARVDLYADRPHRPGFARIATALFQAMIVALVFALANGIEYGLTASIFTNDIKTAFRAARAVKSGYVWINGASGHFYGTPFGGFKNSGLGREEGIDELLSYTEVKTIHVLLGELAARD